MKLYINENDNNTMYVPANIMQEVYLCAVIYGSVYKFK
jgi:hypothetical protein